MSERLRLGLIGCGFAGREIHAPRLARLPELFEVVATCDIDLASAEVVARTVGGAQIFGDARALLDTCDLDAVAIATPLHGAHVTAALNRGLDVFVEKPLAEDPATAAAVAELAADTEKVVLVGTMREYDAILEDARAALDEIRPLLWVELHDVCSGANSAVASDGLVEPILQSALGSPSGGRRSNALQTALLELVHDVSIVRALFGGSPRCVDVSADGDGWSLQGRLELPGGVPCIFGVAEFGRVRAQLFEVEVRAIGEGGVVRIAFSDANDPRLPTHLYVSGRERVSRATDAYAAQWRHFHHCVRTRRAGNARAAAADVELLYEIVERAVGGNG